MELKIHKFTNWQLLLDILNAKSTEGYQLIENKKNIYIFEENHNQQYVYFMVNANHKIPQEYISIAEKVKWDFYHTVSWKLLPRTYKMELYRINIRKYDIQPEFFVIHGLRKISVQARDFLCLFYVCIPWIFIMGIWIHYLSLISITFPFLLKNLMCLGILLLTTPILYIWDHWCWKKWDCIL